MTSSEPIEVYIALGANLGDRAGTLKRALELLEENQYVHVLKVSGFYETAAVGGPAGQGKYLNAAARLETALSARELLTLMLKIERRLGRDRSSSERNLPRPLDLDILFYGNQITDEPELMVPHPRLHERDFVLGPLNEIAPNFSHPRLKKTVSELCAALANG